MTTVKRGATERTLLPPWDLEILCARKFPGMKTRHDMFRALSALVGLDFETVRLWFKVGVPNSKAEMVRFKLRSDPG